MDLARQLCTTDGCDKRRRYGWAMKKPIKCREHAETGMENVIPYEKCKGSDGDEVCTKRPNYGWPGQKKRTHCKAHCQPGMEDLNNRKCGCPDGTMAGCKLRPKFGFPGERFEVFGAHVASTLDSPPGFNFGSGSNFGLGVIAVRGRVIISG